MTHPDVENLVSDYLEGLLPADSTAGMEAHLAGCSACREMVEGVRQAMALCRSAEELEPAPWLVSKIMLATTGERRLPFWKRWAGFLRPSLQSRFTYAGAMAVFSLSMIVNATGVNLRHLSARDLNPLNWAERASTAGQLLLARAEKFCYNLPVVYEIESRFQRLRSQPQQDEQKAPEPEAPAGGTAGREILRNPQLALFSNFPRDGWDRVAIDSSSNDTNDDMSLVNSAWRRSRTS